MENSFSEKYGYSQIPASHFIYEEAPEQLQVYIKKVVYENMQKSPSFLRTVICQTLLTRENKDNWSEYPNIDNEVDDYLHNMEWYKVYDVIESLANVFGKKGRLGQFEDLINQGFQRIGIGWQLKDGVIQTRGNEAFEQTLDTTKTKLEESGLAIAQKELNEAILDLSKRPEPDLRGSVQHSMGALESVAREISGDKKKTLGEILKAYPNIVPKPLDDSLSKMWGFASEFARHVREDRDIGRKEAQLILGISSSVISYIIDSAQR